LLARKSFLLIGFKLVSQVLALVALLYMTRFLGEDVYGSITLTIAMVGSLNIVADLGFTSAHIKRISEGKDIDDCVSTYATIKLVLTGLVVLLTIGGILFYKFVLGQRFMDTSTSIIILILIYYVLYDLAQIAIYTFDAKIETFKSQFSLLIDPLLRVPLIIFISVSRLGTTELAIAYLIGAAGVAVVAFLLFKRDQIHWKKPTLFRSYWAYAAPLTIVAIISTLQQYTDRLFLGVFGTTHDVASYYSGYTLLTVFGVIGSAVATTVFPAISRLHLEGDLKGIASITKEAERTISLLCMPALIFVTLFPNEITRILLSETFKDSGPFIQILAFGTLIVLLNQPYSAQLSGVGHTRMLLKLTLLYFVLDSVLVILLVPETFFGIPMFGLGTIGVAVAYVVTVGVNSLVTRIATRKISKTVVSTQIGLHILATIVAVIAVTFIGDGWEINRWYDLIGMALIFESIYLVILIATRELRRRDIDFILSVISPSRMRDYIKGELNGKK